MEYQTAKLLFNIFSWYWFVRRKLVVINS